MNRLFQLLQVKSDAIISRTTVTGIDEKVRLIHYIWVCFVVVLVSIFPIAYNVYIHNYTLTTILIVFDLFLIATLIIIPYLQNVNRIFYASAFLYGSLLFYLLCTINGDISKILWFYTYPLGTIFLFGNRQGLLTSTILLGLFFVAYLALPSVASTFSPLFVIRFTLTYIVVVSITAWFEHQRYRFFQDATKTHADLLLEQTKLNQEIERRVLLENELRHLSQVDSLTGAYNRRTFWQLAQKEISKVERYHIPISLAILDIDDFKLINDTYGHPTGDKILKILSKHAQASLRQSDLFARIGGEEFAFLLVHVDNKTAYTKMDRLRQELESLKIFHEGPEGSALSFTVSIGISTLKEGFCTLEHLYKEADAHMYKAKRNGRNCVR